MNSKVIAKVIADSISPGGVRLTTLEVTMHRFVLAEFNTHRVFSRNSASSRAIPMKKFRRRALEETMWPLWWGANQAGMQAREELKGWRLIVAKRLWELALQLNCLIHWGLEKVGLHKQISNRLLEPWVAHTVIVTSTEWENFFAQRCHPDAMPEMRECAERMREALGNSAPKRLEYGDYHLPYADQFSPEILPTADYRGTVVKVSVARCARVSYLTQDGRRDHREDLQLYNRLSAQTPPHASPMEHVATPAREGEEVKGNFRGWHQWRHCRCHEEVQDA